MTDWQFISALLAVILVAAWFLWRAFGRANDSQADFANHRAKRYTKLYQEYSNKLEQDLSRGYLDQSEYDIAHAEAGRKLLAQVDALSTVNTKGIALKKYLLPVLCVLLLAGVSTYYTVGAYPDLAIKEQLVALNKVEDAEAFHAVKKTLKPLLNKRIEQKPDNIDYRLLLARFAMQEQNYTEAAKQFRLLAEMLPEDAQAQAYYAQALFLRDEKVVSDDVKTLVENALLIDPDNITALGMQGMYSYEQQDYLKAVSAWQRLLSLLPANSANAAMIAKGVEQAKAELSDEQRAILAGFSVAITVADSVPLESLSPKLTVFVFAKAVGGPNFPLAAKRLTLEDLPITIQLSDADAMTAAKLSDFTNVEVTARISTTGKPEASTGDWFGKSDAVVWRELSSTLPVVIDQNSQ